MLCRLVELLLVRHLIHPENFIEIVRNFLINWQTDKHKDKDKVPNS